jgi:DNA invertase Pin-like site-specific DNA recombinase
MNSIIYARVSSKEQEQEGYSIPAQLKLLNDYALKNGYKIVKEFIDVETAKRAGRENFNLMIDYLKKNADVKAILCEKTDRLSRNFRDIAILDDLINQQSLSIILVKENTTISRDSKSHEKFIFGIKALMAKNYIDNLSEETRKGMLEKAEQGIYPSSAPLGYKNCEAKKDGRVFKYLEVDEQRAPILQKLFRMYATGDYSLALLTKQAYEEGLRNKGGGKVGKAAIHKILHNPIYYGAFRWYGKLYPGSHPALVSKELFNAVQEAFEAQNRPKQTKRHFAYTGLMVCGRCGCAITAEIKKGKYIYYHCTGFKGKCGNSWVPEKVLEEQFAEIVKRIHINEDILELVKNALLSSHKEELEFHKKRIEILNGQKTKLENRLHQIYIDKIDGKVSEEFFDEMTDKWQEELSQIKEQIGRHENSDSNYLSQGVHILELCNKAHRLYLQQTPLKRAKLLHYLLSNCALDNATLCPTYRKPFDIIAKGLSRSNWLPREDSDLGPGGYK